jgi:restriction system protein
MKLKMAKNSLFAVLLRSPWWMSLALVGVFVMASIALLPPQYVGFGVMGGLPFLVIAVMAAWRQWHAPNPAKVAQALEMASAMSWKDFSKQVEQGFVRQGYVVTRLSGGAADFQLTKAERVTLVSCKRWKAASQGVDTLRDLAAAKDAQGAQYAMLISLGAITAQASRYAQAQGLFLMTEPELAQLLTP